MTHNSPRTFVEKHHFGRVHDRVQPVGDGQHGGAREDLADARLEDGVRLVVDRRGRLVQHDDGGLAQHGAREAEQLALADGEVRSGLADGGEQPLLELGDWRLELRVAHDGLDLGVRVLGEGVEVVLDRLVEQHGVLVVCMLTYVHTRACNMNMQGRGIGRERQRVSNE